MDFSNPNGNAMKYNRENSMNRIFKKKFDKVIQLNQIMAA